MKRSEKILILVLVIIAVITLVVAIGITENKDLEIPDSSIDLSYVKYFDPEKVTRVDITIDEDLFRTLIEKDSNGYGVASVSLNGDTYDNVGIKIKGDSSKKLLRESKTSERFSFKLKADEFANQTMAGLDEFILNSNIFDATMMREYLSYDILKMAGVKTPLFAFATVYINGEYWGFYLMIEGVNQSFLKRNYGVQNGNLYKPEGKMGMFTSDGYVPDPSYIHFGGHLEFSGDDIFVYDELFSHPVTVLNTSTSRGKIVDSIKHINEGDNLEKYLQSDEIIAYMAANAAMSNTDSYLNMVQTHNFYVYEVDGKITLFPWDNDESLGPYFLGPSYAVNLPIDTPVQIIRGKVSLENLPLMRIIVENPEYHKRYYEKLRYIAENLMGETLVQKIDDISKKIRPYMETDPHVSFPVDEYFDKAISNLKKFVLLRTESILAQLDGKIPTTYEEQKLHPETLIDPGDLDLNAIGSPDIWKSLWP